MPSNVVGEDLRSIKTVKALYSAMFSLLSRTGFRKLTIKSICEEAMISRAAFYAHFVDKYDLLRHWIAELMPEDFSFNDTYEEIEKSVNIFICENKSLLKNLLYDADNETIDILSDFIISTINPTYEKDIAGQAYALNIVLSNFYAGGLISYILWLVKNKFPQDVPPMNSYLYKMLNQLKDWQSI